jgi:hypothetical protein
MILESQKLANVHGQFKSPAFYFTYLAPKTTPFTRQHAYGHRHTTHHLPISCRQFCRSNVMITSCKDPWTSLTVHWGRLWLRTRLYTKETRWGVPTKVSPVRSCSSFLFVAEGDRLWRLDGLSVDDYWPLRVILRLRGEVSRQYYLVRNPETSQSTGEKTRVRLTSNSLYVG